MTLDGRIGESLYSSRRAMAYKITNAMRRFYMYKEEKCSIYDRLNVWVEWRKIRVENLKKKVRKQTFALNAFGKVNRSTEADLLFILGNGLETVLVSTRPVEVCNAREAASPRDHYSGSGSRITAKYSKVHAELREIRFENFQKKVRKEAFTISAFVKATNNHSEGSIMERIILVFGEALLR
ncbi:hypothetical protein T4D_10989 [Trichinella pseudospiralis]|uniref:Uncharacterized protein n=1 Tax=Trichinella pseudospiralis TaxID=6337 RepID=A0A0V1G631_TRIPS|nr:hypothetical protein T4D_10989 [Trichinella pseudospiralis]